MKGERYSHPGKRKNTRQHGTVGRYDAGCRCWRCFNAAVKDAKRRVMAAEKGSVAA